MGLVGYNVPFQHKKVSASQVSGYGQVWRNTMTVVFNLATIAAGVLLSIGFLRDLQGIGWRLQKLAFWLDEYRQYIGWVCLGFGAFFLLFEPGHEARDLVGGCAGLLLLRTKLLLLPGIGRYLQRAADKLISLDVALGIAAIVVGFLGLLQVPLFG